HVVGRARRERRCVVNAEETRQGVEALIKAGRDVSTVEQRTDVLPIEYRGVTVNVPIAATVNGVSVMSDAIAHARELHQIERPDRNGRYAMADLDSLLAWAGRYKTEDTAAFLTAPAYPAAGRVEVIIDELPRGTAGCRRALSATLALKLSERLTEWLELDDEWQSAEDFYSFIDDHTDDLTTAD